MGRSVENDIEQYMQHSAVSGHFEHSLNEIRAGLNSQHARETIIRALAKMESSNLLKLRTKGTTKLYHLAVLEELSRNYWVSSS